MPNFIAQFFCSQKNNHSIFFCFFFKVLKKFPCDLQQKEYKIRKFCTFLEICSTCFLGKNQFPQLNLATADITWLSSKKVTGQKLFSPCKHWEKHFHFVKVRIKIYFLHWLQRMNPTFNFKFFTLKSTWVWSSLLNLLKLFHE